MTDEQFIKEVHALMCSGGWEQERKDELWELALRFCGITYITSQIQR